jgi:Trypsin-like peptidase domain
MDKTIRKGLVCALALVALGSASGRTAVIGLDDRRTFPQYVVEHSLDADQAWHTFAPSGRLICNLNVASAFLVYRSNIIVTARHVLYPELDQKSYAGRMRIHKCGLEITDGKNSVWHYVDLSTITYLSDPQRSHTDRFDWLVMRLPTPIEGLTPYELPSDKPKVGEPVTAVTSNQLDFPPNGVTEHVIADCHVQDVVSIDGIDGAGLKTDCSANGGASGGAVIRKSGTGYEAIGLISSNTSYPCPSFQAYGCFSFAVGITGPVVNAIKRLASPEFDSLDSK